MPQSVPSPARPHRADRSATSTPLARPAEGDGSMKDLLGGKGAGLAEMTGPACRCRPGSRITTEACNDYFAAGERLPDGLWDDVEASMRVVEQETGKGFGSRDNPLLVSVRSGAKFSMPGMMDTVLNLGLNEDTLQGLIRLTGNERFGWDAYRRFIQMFGRIVMGVSGEAFDEALAAAKKQRGAAGDTDLVGRGHAGARVDVSRHRPAGDGTRLPGGPARAARSRHQGRVCVVVRPARPRLPRLQPHPGRPRHRRQRRHDGVRQHGWRLGHGRGLHPRPEHRREGALR